MINEALKAFVEKADGDVIRVKVNDHDLYIELSAIGFFGALEDGVFERYVADDVEKAKVFEYLRDKASLSGKFVRVSWTQSGQYRLESV